MLSQFARSLAPLLLAAFPLFAISAPVTVTTETSGISHYGDEVVLGTLGIRAFEYSALPYTMTLQSSFDTDINFSFWFDSTRLWVSDVDLSVTFQLGTETFTQQGKGTVMLSSTPGRYTQEVFFSTSIEGKTVYFTNGLNADQGAGDGDPLMPRDLRATGGSAGFMDIDAVPSNPDAPGYWTMGDSATSSTVVVSSVPEPSQWAMMAAGLLAATAAARRRRQA